MRPALFVTALVVVASVASTARAHPLGFALVTIDATSPSQTDVLVRISGTELEPGAITLGWPEGCEETIVRDAMHDEVRERRSVITGCSLVGRTLRVEGPPRGLEVRLEARLPGRAPAISTLGALPAEVALDRAPSALETSTQGVRLGFAHFALGIDHVLFVIGAFLLARRRGARAIALAVTSFTIGHALTLAWVTLSGIALPTRPVEACIALSLVHVARELRIDADTWTRRAPALVCFVFGLIHGAGLASAMSATGLVGGALALSALAFNVGLELAELGLVLALLALVRGPRALALERALPLCIGAIGVWLLLDRIALA